MGLFDMEQLLSILMDIRPDLDFTKEGRLIDDDLLDSFDIITVVSEINDTFNVRVGVADLIPENMNSAAGMWALINRLKSS
jgi:acyl carrier protein